MHRNSILRVLLKCEGTSNRQFNYSVRQLGEILFSKNSWSAVIEMERQLKTIQLGQKKSQSDLNFSVLFSLKIIEIPLIFIELGLFCVGYFTKIIIAQPNNQNNQPLVEYQYFFMSIKC